MRKEGPLPEIHDITDGQRFDLGGGRIVTAYDCPGHTAGDSIKAYEASRKDNHDLIRMEERQKNIEKELNRLVDFIKKFDNAPETIMDSILELEAEKKQLVQSIQLEKLKAGQLKDMDLGEMYRKYLNANLSDPAFRTASLPLRIRNHLL